MNFNEETDEYTCNSESECSRLRCECDATLAIDLAVHFVNAGTDDLDSANLGLTKEDCGPCLKTKEALNEILESEPKFGECISVMKKENHSALVECL